MSVGPDGRILTALREGDQVTTQDTYTTGHNTFILPLDWSFTIIP